MAIFDFAKMTYIDTIWFVSWDLGDWMGAIFKETPDGPWCVRYRFRYYAGPDPWDGKDVKNVYEATLPNGSAETLTKVLAAYTSLIDEITNREPHARQWRVDVHGDTAQCFKLLSQQPWAHIKVQAKPPEGVM